MGMARTWQKGAPRAPVGAPGEPQRFRMWGGLARPRGGSRWQQSQVAISDPLGGPSPPPHQETSQGWRQHTVCFWTWHPPPAQLWLPVPCWIGVLGGIGHRAVTGGNAAGGTPPRPAPPVWAHPRDSRRPPRDRARHRARLGRLCQQARRQWCVPPTPPCLGHPTQGEGGGSAAPMPYLKPGLATPSCHAPPAPTATRPALQHPRAQATPPSSYSIAPRAAKRSFLHPPPPSILPEVHSFVSAAASTSPVLSVATVSPACRVRPPSTLLRTPSSPKHPRGSPPLRFRSAMALKMSLAATPFCPGGREWHSARQAARMTEEEERWLEAQMAAAAGASAAAGPSGTSSSGTEAEGATTASSVAARMERMALAPSRPTSTTSTGQAAQANHGLTAEEQEEFDRWISGAIGRPGHA